MGNYFKSEFQTEFQTEYQRNFLKIERLIDSENEIIIGIVSSTHQQNPYSSQAIRIGLNGKIKQLEKFIELPNNLIFEYETGTIMTLSKKNEDDIIINIKDPDTSITIIKPMDLFLRKTFKPMSWKTLSEEYDKICNFIEPKYENLIMQNFENKKMDSIVMER
jgi:hypothetical protein